MNHLIIAPVLLPCLTAVLLLFLAKQDKAIQRAVSVLSTLALLAVSIALVAEAAKGGFGVYSLGDWPVPFGIILVLDRLSAGMVLLTSVVAVGSLLYAVQGWDLKGTNFHALFQFQLMGLNGAFLTGDIFNLFVFFEVLLIASYGLLLHGGGADRVRAGLHYVVVNLTGSALFLIALGIIYGTFGTLNMADMAAKAAGIAPESVPLAQAGAFLLLVVFSIKAAVLPLYFWLPGAYRSASAPVAALFAIMTKVGIYSILRVFTLVFGPEGGVLADIALPILVPAGLLTLGLAALGALAAKDLRTLLAYLVIVSVGTLLVALGISGQGALAAGLYYLVHSTVVVAGLFLLAELIRNQRGDRGDTLLPAPPVRQPAILGSLFFLGAMGVAGLPPLSGFLGKALLLRSAVDSPHVAWIFGVVLLGSLLSLVALSRAGSVLFWKTEGSREPEGGVVSATGGALLPVILFLGMTSVLVLAAGPIYTFADAIAAQLANPAGYISGVLGGGS